MPARRRGAGRGAGNKTLGVGGFARMPANMHHFAYTTAAETTIVLYGQGPVEFKYINPPTTHATRRPPLADHSRWGRARIHVVIHRWRGNHDRWQSFRLGVDHGLFCVGCCWTLMLLMFVVGMTNLAWMFALGVVMTVEKKTMFGRRISGPVGIVLLAWGTATSLPF